VLSDQHETPLDLVIIGGSQAGLAAAYHLRKRGLRFVMLDAGAAVGQVWKSRWDSLTLFTPAQYSGLPGLGFPAAQDAYPSKDEVAAYLQSYASTFDLPVRLNATVTSLSRDGGGYLVATKDEVFWARQVVVATGPFHAPFVPQTASGLDPSVAQIHSAQYRSPAQLPEGPVLVVGGGNSGFQIAAELAETRRVDLAVGRRMPALPQRLLGRDLFWWLSHLGIMRVTVESRLGRRMAKRDVLIGSSRRLVLRAGVTIRKRLERFEGRRAVFADGSRLDVGAVIWATGYRSDHAWIEVPGVLDEDGHVLHRRGITAAPGLFFVGLPWQHTRGSALLGFVQADAAFIAETIAVSGRAGVQASSSSGGALASLPVRPHATPPVTRPGERDAGTAATRRPRDESKRQSSGHG
jgi:putative flavoprotein involved in K+ transport